MSEAKVGIVGSGGREATFAHVLNRSPLVDKIYGLNGNPYFDRLRKGESVPGKPTRDHVASFAVEHELDLVIFGPEAPLIAGDADALRELGIRAIGPSQKAARLEGSKIFAQEFNERYGNPCPEAFIARTHDQAKAFMQSSDYNPRMRVTKLDGEAGGKGVDVSQEFEDAEEFVRQAFEEQLYNNAAARGLLFQIREGGPEVSSFWAVDINGHKVNLGRAQDYKRQKRGDEGKNTGGMGSYSPVAEHIFGPDEARQDEEITDNLIRGCQEEGMPYEGFIYNGYMKVRELDTSVGGLQQVVHKLKVIEYNVRYGDPEAQVNLPALQRAGLDFYEFFDAMADGRLDEVEVPEVTETSVAICLADGGYPESTTPNTKIRGLGLANDNAFVIDAGVKEERGEFLTTGGRVGYSIGFGENGDEAYANAEELIAQDESDSGVYFPGMQYRNDIAWQIRNMEAA